MIAWFTRNSVASNLLMIALIVAGLFSLFRFIPLEVFPSFSRDIISINMELRGATPQNIEQSISIKVEEAIADLEGIKKITSHSTEGGATINVEVDTSANTRDLLTDIKSRVDSINTFPTDAEKAIIQIEMMRHSVIMVTLASEYSEKQTLEYAQNLRDKLLQIHGISQVELTGIRDFEISIEVSQDKLLQHNLTLTEISQAVRSSSIDLSSGNLKTLRGDIFVSLKGQAYNKNDFSSIFIKRKIDGSYITLGDIATIRDGFEETPIRSRFNNKNAVFINVNRVGSESAIDVADKVKSFIEKQQVTLPRGYELSYWDDNSEIVKSRLETLGSSALLGSLLIIILLTLFLQPTIAFWVFIGIPVSFAGAFLVMPVFDVSLNVLSLFGFILVLGIVVDDAIVTGENIYSHLKKSESGEIAAINGTREISTPVTFGVLTTIAAFLPLAFIQGDRSIIFTQLPYVIVPILIFSLIESKFILPSHLKHIKLRREKERNNWFERFQHRFADSFENLVLKYYQPILNLAINNKLTTLTLFIATLVIVITLIIGGWTKFIVFPRIPADTVSVTLTMPTGTPFEITNKHIIAITKKAELLRDKYIDETTGESIVLNIMTTTGGRGGNSNLGQVMFEITPAEKREIKVTSTQLANEWRKLIGDITGSQSLSFRAELGGGGSPIDIQLSGSNLSTLKEIAIQVKGHLETYDTVFDITDSLSDGKDELNIELTIEGKLLGLTKQNVALQVRNALYGAQIQRIQRGRDDVRVMIRLSKSERTSVSNLEKIIITTINGTKISLGNIATLVPSKGPSIITRIDRFRTVNILADIEKENTNMLILQKEFVEYLDTLMLQYPNIDYTLEGEAREQSETFSSLVLAFIFVIFVIYALLAIPFKSYLQPIIVMGIIPFGVIGAVVGHWIMGMPLTILSIMGIFALIGVVVNDSLVLVDYINKQYAKSNDLLSSVLSAGSARFRPVILTSLTTFFGLLPLLFEKSIQAQFLIPMATSLAFGVLFSTFTTLVLVPVIYILIEKIRFRI